VKVLVVGSGTAGLISACILKKHLNIQVDVVSSKDIGIIGVGEGTTEHLAEFIDFMGINRNELIARSDATYKAGILFEDWTSNPYFYAIEENFVSLSGQDRYVLQRQIGSSSSLLCPKFVKTNQIPVNMMQDGNGPTLQYHLNTFKLNEYLVDICKGLGITFYEDKISDVLLSSDGSIDFLVGEKQNYNYDFYIDSTGFKRLLIGKLGARWKSYGEFLKMKSAFVFQTEDEEEYNIWTHVKAMKSGWKFKIPVWGRHGNGYIYDSDYTTLDEAVKEVEDTLERKIDVGRTFNFDPGCLDQTWIKNCCAIGLSGSFAEPLEATAIGTSIQQSFLLMSKIVGYSQYDIKSYNKSVNDIMENARDFIFLHYMVERNDTAFWKDLKNVNAPDSLQEKLNLWKTRLPIREDFSGLSNYVLFTESHHALVLEGIGLVDRSAIMKKYDSLSVYTRRKADEIVNWYDTQEELIPRISHKGALRLVRQSMGL